MTTTAPPTRPLRLAVCGPGRHGKDTVAIWLANHTTLRYRESTSEAATVLVKSQLDLLGIHYRSNNECFADRHNCRDLWADIIWQYNKPDGLTLYREMVERDHHDILNGIRRPGELHACCRAGLVDLSIFVDRSKHEPPERSCEITADDCDIVLPNNDPLEALYVRLIRLARSWGVLKVPA